MAVVRWTFYNPDDDTTVTVPFNPNAGGSPDYEKQFTYQTTAAPGGATIIFEGGRQPQEMTASGVILTEDQYNLYLALFNVEHQMLLTDDLGRQFWVAIKGFKPTRAIKAHYPWYHTYDLALVIVDYA